MTDRHATTKDKAILVSETNVIVPGVEIIDRQYYSRDQVGTSLVDVLAEAQTYDCSVIFHKPNSMHTIDLVSLASLYGGRFSEAYNFPVKIGITLTKPSALVVESMTFDREYKTEDLTVLVHKLNPQASCQTSCYSTEQCDADGTEHARQYWVVNVYMRGCVVTGVKWIN